MTIPPLSPQPSTPPLFLSGGPYSVSSPVDDLTPAQRLALSSTNELNFLPASDITLKSFFAQLSELRKQLQDQLKINEIADGSSRDGVIHGMLDEANRLSELYESMLKNIHDLQSLVASVKSSIDTVNSAITDFNASDATNNQSSIGTMQAAINIFNGITSGVNTTLSSSKSSQTDKDNAVNSYNTAVANLNSAIQTFQGQAASSNNAAINYNTAASTYLTIAQFDNNLIALFNSKSDLVKLDAQPVDIPQSVNLSAQMPTLSSIPTSPSPTSVSTYTQSPSNFLPVYTFLPISALKVPVSVEVVNALAVILSIFAPSFLQLFNILIFGSTTLEAIDSFNDKKWNDPNVLKYSIVPPNYFKAYSNYPVASNPTSAGGITTTVSIIGLGSGKIENAFNKALIADIVKKADPGLTENAINELIKLLLLLIAGLLNASAAGAVPGALGAITPALSSITRPPNSPTLVVVAALSTLNRNIEVANSNSLKNLINNFIEKTPAFANLTEPQKASLALELIGAFSLTLLFLGAKTLLAGLGLPEFLAQLLGLIPNLPPTINEILSNPAPSTTKLQEDQKIQKELKNIFLERGFGQDESEFLASIGLTSLQNKFLQPTAPTITPATTNIDLVRDSLAAQLLLNDELKLSVVGSREFAATILRQAIREADSIKTPRVRDEITNVLIQNGINSHEAQIIASNVLFIPNPEILLQSTPQISPTTSLPPLSVPPVSIAAATGVSELPPLLSESPPILSVSPAISPIPTKQLSTDQLIAILEKRAFQLLAPELGPELAKVITKNIIEALLGPPTVSNTATEKNLANPNSFIRIVGENLRESKITKNEDRQNAVKESFREYIQPSVDLNPFLLKLLDPAYGPIAMVSIIYGETKTQFSVGQGRSSGVDIPI